MLHRVDNAFYVSETVQDAIYDANILFDARKEGEKGCKVVGKGREDKGHDGTPVGVIMMHN